MAKSKKKKSSLLGIILAVVVIAAIGVGGYLFCSSRIFGSYEAKMFGIGTTYTFSGIDSVSIDFSASIGGLKVENENSLTGKYSIKDNKITFTFENSDGSDNSKEATKYSGTHDFEKGDGYIKIDGVQLDKVKK